MAFTQMRSALDARALEYLCAPDGKHYSSTLIGCCLATLAFTHLILRDFTPTCKDLQHFSLFDQHVFLQSLGRLITNH